MNTALPTKITFFLCCCFPFLLFSQIKKEYFDGPYIFDVKDSLQIQWVEAGVGHDSLIAKSKATIFDRPSLPKVDLQKLNFKKDDQVVFKNIEGKILNQLT